MKADRTTRIIASDSNQRFEFVSGHLNLNLLPNDKYPDAVPSHILQQNPSLNVKLSPPTHLATTTQRISRGWRYCPKCHHLDKASWCCPCTLLLEQDIPDTPRLSSALWKTHPQHTHILRLVPSWSCCSTRGTRVHRGDRNPESCERAATGTV